MILNLVLTLVNLGFGVLYLSAVTTPNKSVGNRVWHFLVGVGFFALAGTWLWDLLQGFCGS